MSETRLKTVDDSDQTQEELLLFARNFAAEADRLQGIVTNQRLAIDGLVEAVKDTGAWHRHTHDCHITHGHDTSCNCGHDKLHTAVEAAEEAKG